MLSENEIDLLVEIPEISIIVEDLRNQFSSATSMEDITNHDFLSSMLMAPAIGMALANGTISLLEELSLNKKARSFSKGGFFLKQDPVVKVAGYLIAQFDTWEELLYSGLKKILKIVLIPCQELESHTKGMFITMLNTSYLFIKLVETFFLPEGEEIIANERSIAEIEYHKLISIGSQLELSEVPLFSEFLRTFEVK